jgi:hypothetical protein
MASKSPPIAPDKAEAAKFLAALDPSAQEFTFQSFDDNSDRKSARLTQVLHGSLDQHFETLAALSAQGAGIFVTINETDGRGRKAENVTRVRAVFVDTDGTPQEPIEAALPHIVVESSPGNYHDYWLVKDCSFEDFRLAQKKLAETYGSDSSVNDLSRVLRLPGFHHQKIDSKKGLIGTPYMVRMIDSTAHFGPDQWAFRKEKIDQAHAAKMAVTSSPLTLAERVTAAIQPPAGHKGPIIDLGGASASYTSTGPSEAEAHELLGYLDPDMPYEDWLSVLMALHDAGDHMLPLAIEWSSEGSKFRPGEIERKWRGFTHGSGVGWPTIPAMARDNGAPLAEIARTHAKRAANATVTADIGQYGPTATQQMAFPFVQVGSLHYRTPEYVIDGLLETETLGLIFGDPGCGKSFLAVDIAAAVATGTPFHGRATKQGAVFFIAGEGHNGLVRRFAAWSKARSTSLDDAPLFKSERAAQFLDADSASAVANAVSGLAAQHGAPALIVIDTLARNFGSGDENNTRDMSEFVVAIDDLKALFPGCSVLIVHHSGHADKQRARGAMALKGALDAEYRVEKPKEGDLIRLICTKMKDAEPPKDMAFKFVPVALGDAQSAVLEATDAPERQKKLTPTQALAVSAYRTAADKKGQWSGGAFMGVHLNDWRLAFYAKHTGDSADAKRKAFLRARNELVEKRIFYVHNDLYLIRNPEEQLAILGQRDNRDMPGHCAKCPDAEAGNSGTSGTCA